eukprot:365407-Chlamydomonas_euryale.AAC.5
MTGPCINARGRSPANPAANQVDSVPRTPPTLRPLTLPHTLLHTPRIRGVHAHCCVHGSGGCAPRTPRHRGRCPLHPPQPSAHLPASTHSLNFKP